MKKMLKLSACALIIYCIGTTNVKAQLKILSNGNVGVGTTTPAYLFQIGGGTKSIVFNSSVAHTSDYGYNALLTVTRGLTKALAVQNTSNSTENLVIYGDGSLIAMGTWRWSDERFKRNIKPISDPSGILQRLSGKTYDFNKELVTNKNALTQKEYGFIAQELINVIPEAVKVDEKGYYAVNYEAIIPILVEALKEQNLKINELSNQLQNSTGKQNNIGTASKVKSGAQLYQNTPNPFSEQTTIRCIIPTGNKNALLVIYNLNGEQIASFPINGEGEQSININGNTLQAGSYYYTLLLNGVEVDTKKMILLK